MLEIKSIIWEIRKRPHFENQTFSERIRPRESGGQILEIKNAFKKSNETNFWNQTLAGSKGNTIHTD